MAKATNSYFVFYYEYVTHGRFDSSGKNYILNKMIRVAELNGFRYLDYFSADWLMSRITLNCEI